MLGLIALVALFACADRFAGGPFVKRLRWRGRPCWYAGAVLAAALAALGQLHAAEPGWAWLALAWFAWREPKWALFGGDLTPDTRRAGFGFFLRHLFFLGAALAAWRLGRDPVLAAAAVVVWAALATLLGGVLNRYGVGRPWLNGWIETTRGALQGLAVAAILLA